MDYLKVVYSSIFSILALFLLTKMIGKKQIAQFTMFDYVNGITIGSIAAEMATELEDNPLKELLAMVVYALVVLLFSVLTNKSLAARRFLTGRPIILFENEKIYVENLAKAKIDVNEFLMQARGQGYFNLSNIDTAVLEPNGSISFLPKSDNKPLTPKDMNITVQQEKPCFNVVIDGNILHRNLKAAGKNENWLDNELKKQDIKSVDDVFLAFCDNTDTLTVYTQNRDGGNFSIFD